MDIRFDKVTVRFAGGATALDGLSLHIPAGQFCVVLGRSGAGKSTLLRAVNGLARPAEGRVIVGGQTVDRASLPALRARIGMVHQLFGLTPRASVADSVVAGAAEDMPLWRALLGFYPAPVRARACELLAAVGLEETHLVRRADQLSGGQQQRVGIARALMRDPAIILADEPVASLDPRSSGEIMALIRDQARLRGATVLCSLHQLDLARRFADRIVAIREGRILFDGPPAMLDEHDCGRIFGWAPPAHAGARLEEAA